MTTDQKHAIEALRHEGAGYGAIAARLGIPREAVYAHFVESGA